MITNHNLQFPTNQDLYQALADRQTPVIQEKLWNAKVAICGLGGLGSNIAISLARSGIRHLHLIDFDRVDITNLNRQQYFLAQLGQPKTEALKKTILEFAPYCQIHTDFLKITPDHIPDLFQNEDIICEAFDLPEAKAMLTNHILELCPDKFLVGASGMAGYGPNKDIRTRRILPNYYLCGDGNSQPCEGYGLMAPRVMLCAAAQANTVIRHILGVDL